jgi:5-methylcytosine-specific restriction enzyme subunit McrC
MGIPVANIYYLLCYAWDEFVPHQMAGFAAEEFPDTLHLFSHLLAVGVRAVHRRGLDRGYVVIQESTSTVRGRIRMRDTIRLCAKQPQRVFCAFDEMTVDIVSNQILRATARRLLGANGLKPELRTQMREALSLLAHVTEIELSSRLFHEVHLHQNNRLYSFLINICRFFFESLEAQEHPGQYRFREVDRDEKRMRRVFEKFVRNFFARRQMTFHVKQDRVEWFATALEGSDLHLLPLMMTDATLRSPNRTIVVECKYTESLYQSRFFADKLRSSHLYQLCSYLRNLEGNSEPDKSADGILLYPTAGNALDQSYLLHGHRIRIKTLDLNQTWQEIEQEMQSLLQPIVQGAASSGTGGTVV